MARESNDAYFSFENLEVYQLAEDLVVSVYAIANSFPSQERFALTNQLIRTVNSISLNIAEGKGRGTDRDFLRFLYIARGSLLETVGALRLAKRLNYTSAETVSPIREQCRILNSKLNALIIYLESQNP